MTGQNPIPVAAAAEVTTMTLGHQHDSMEYLLHPGPTMTSRIIRKRMMMGRQNMVVLTDPGARDGRTDQADVGDQEVQEVQGIRKVQVLGSNH